jgi:hydroxymethylpyrimidine pyrophosphatase-like HAD family hydrolase
MAPLPFTGILAFDFDGTLIDHTGRPVFDPRLAQTIARLCGQGAAWVINTGRSLEHTLDGIGTYGIDTHGLEDGPHFIISREHEIWCRSASGGWEDAGGWTTRCAERHESFFEHHEPLFAQVREFLDQESLGLWIGHPGDPAGVMLHDEAAMPRLLKFLHPFTNTYPDLGMQRNSIWMRFTLKDLNKGSALKELARQLSLGPEDIFAAGDNHNDMSMLRREIAHRLCCPSNALPEVKALVRQGGGVVATAPASRGMLEGLAHYFAR